MATGQPVSSSEPSDNEGDKSREFGHGTNVKRQQFNTKQRMDMYAFCVLELELHGGKVSIRKQSDIHEKVLPISKTIKNEPGFDKNRIKNKIDNDTVLQYLRQPGDIKAQYQLHQQRQIQLQQLQQQQNRLQQQQQNQPHVRRVILLKRLPPKQSDSSSNIPDHSIANQDDVQNQPIVEEEDESQYTYEPSNDVIGEHLYSKKMEDFIEQQPQPASQSTDDIDQTNKQRDEMIKQVNTITNDIVFNKQQPHSMDTVVANENNSTSITSTTNDKVNNDINSNTNTNSCNRINNMIPPKPGTRTKTGRVPSRRSKSPDGSYTYLEPKALWAHQAWAGRKCYSDVQKTQVLTSWMLRNVQQRFAHYYPESAVPSRTTIKHVFQKCISHGTVDNIKNYRKATKCVERDAIEQLLLENPNFSLRQLAQKLNVSTGTVSRRCKALGLVPDSVTLKHQQLATAKRQKQIEALQLEMNGFNNKLTPPKPKRRSKQKQVKQTADPTSGSSANPPPTTNIDNNPGTSSNNNVYNRYYQPPPATACGSSGCGTPSRNK